MKKNMLKALAAVLLLTMLLTLSACGPKKLLLGNWVDSTGNIELQFVDETNVVATMYSFPITVTYTFEGDTLTLIYSEDITDSGIVTFYGDDEFIWDKVDENGEAYQEYYTRDTEQ